MTVSITSTTSKVGDSYTTSVDVTLTHLLYGDAAELDHLTRPVDPSTIPNGRYRHLANDPVYVSAPTRRSSTAPP